MQNSESRVSDGNLTTMGRNREHSTPTEDNRKQKKLTDSVGLLPMVDQASFMFKTIQSLDESLPTLFIKVELEALPHDSKRAAGKTSK